MLLCDWSSDVCSSDLDPPGRQEAVTLHRVEEAPGPMCARIRRLGLGQGGGHPPPAVLRRRLDRLAIDPAPILHVPDLSADCGRTNRKSVETGKSVYGRVEHGGRSHTAKKKKTN